MKMKRALHLLGIITLISMSACGKSDGPVNPDPDPGPDPEPHPAAYITVTDRNTKEVGK